MNIVKDFGENALRWAVRRFPKGARRAHLISLSIDYFLYRKFQELAAKYGISGFVARGDYGAIQGAVTDRVIFRYYAERKIWAADLTGPFADFLRDGGTYLDIGANIGLTTIPIARNPLVSCIALEPEPANFQLLKSNIFANCRHSNVTLYNMALFDRDTTIEFELSPDNSGDHRVRTKSGKGAMGEASRNTIEVSARRLDDLLAEVRAPLAAKIDTQGAEPFIISGGRQVLAKAGFLALEFWPYGMFRMGGDARVVIDFLRTNFRKGMITVVDRGGGGEWQPIDTVAARLAELSDRNSARAHDHVDVIVMK